MLEHVARKCKIFLAGVSARSSQLGIQGSDDGAALHQSYTDMDISIGWLNMSIISLSFVFFK